METEMTLSLGARLEEDAGLQEAPQGRSGWPFALQPPRPRGTQREATRLLACEEAAGKQRPRGTQSAHPRFLPHQIKGKQDHHVTGQKTPLLQLEEQLEEQDPALRHPCDVSALFHRHQGEVV